MIAASPGNAGTLQQQQGLAAPDQAQARGGEEEGTPAQPRRVALGAWVAKKVAALRRVRAKTTLALDCFEASQMGRPLSDTSVAFL